MRWGVAGTRTVTAPAQRSPSVPCPPSAPTQLLSCYLWLNPSKGQTPTATGRAVHSKGHHESWGLGTALQNSTAPAERVRGFCGLAEGSPPGWAPATDSLA